MLDKSYKNYKTYTTYTTHTTYTNYPGKGAIQDSQLSDNGGW